jgi:hypothetical protein
VHVLDACVDVLTKTDTAANGARRQKKIKQKQPAPEVTQKASDYRLQTALVELQTMGFVKVSVSLLPVAAYHRRGIPGD